MQQTNEIISSARLEVAVSQAGLAALQARHVAHVLARRRRRLALVVDVLRGPRAPQQPAPSQGCLFFYLRFLNFKCNQL